MARPAWLGDLGSDPVRQVVIPVLVAVPLALALGFGGAAEMAALVIIAIGGGLFLANPRAFVLAFLALISLRNFVAGGERIGSEAFNFDLGGLVNVLATGIGLVYFLVLWKNPFRGRSLTWPYGLFLLVFAVSVAWSPDLRWAVRFVTRLAAPFFTYLIISDMLDRRMERQVIGAIYASSVIPIVYGFYQWITGTGNDVTEGYNRVNASFFHPAHFSMYLVFLFCLAYAELLGRRRSNPALLVAYIACLVALEIATYTRISWAAMALCWVYLSWVYGKRGYLLSGGIVLAFVLFAAGGGIVDRVTSVGDTLAGEDLYDLNTSVGWRLYFWAEILRRFWDAAWLGHGAGASVMLGVELFGVEAAPHNGYLRVLYETGALGALSFLWVLGTMFWQAGRLLRAAGGTRLTFISHVYITMTLTYALLNVTDNILEYYEVAIYQWAILALVEYTNLRAARAGVLEATAYEATAEVEPEAVAAVATELDDLAGPDPAAPTGEPRRGVPPGGSPRG